MTEAEVAGRIELRLAGEAGAELTTALLRDPSENAEHFAREGRSPTDQNPCKSEQLKGRASTASTSGAYLFAMSPMLRSCLNPNIFSAEENRVYEIESPSIE